MHPPSFTASSLYVAVGGGIGAWLRFLAGRASVSLLGPAAASAFPWTTLLINVLGSFLMGLLAAWLAPLGKSGDGARLLLGTGVLGGFTTFSAFSLDFALLIDRGAIGLSMLYAAVSVTVSFAAVFLGLMLVRSLG